MVLPILLSFAAVIFVVYFFFKRKYAFWKELCVPYVKAKPPFGNLKGLGHKYHFGELLRTHYEALKVKGKRFGFGGIYSFISPTVLVTDLDFVRRVLVDDFEYFQNRGLHLNETDDPLSANLMTLDGDKWKALCKVLIPKFEPSGLEAVLPKMLQVAWNLSKVLSKQAGQEIEICDTLQRLTVDMTAACAFKTKCNSLTEPNELFRRMVERSILTPRLPLIGQMFILEYPRIADVLQTIYVPSTVSKFFMSLTDSRKDPKKVRASTAEAFAFFSAGFETSTSALSFTLYELAANAQLQEKARQSVMGALTSNGKLSCRSLREMSYLEQCINETLRKYPPTTFLTRRVSKDYTVPGTTIMLTRGMHVIVPVYGIHHDPDYWPDPDTYNPDRFSSDNSDKHHLYAFLGFGDGQRQCIGMQYAVLQMKITLATILMDWRVSLGEKSKGPLKIAKNKLSLMPQSKIWLRLEKVKNV